MSNVTIACDAALTHPVSRASFCNTQGAAAALNRDRYGGFHDRHTHGGHVPNPPRLSGSATYRPQLLSGSTLGQSLKRNDSDSRCRSLRLSP